MSRILAKGKFSVHLRRGRGETSPETIRLDALRAGIGSSIATSLRYQTDHLKGSIVVVDDSTGAAAEFRHSMFEITDSAVLKALGIVPLKPGDRHAPSVMSVRPPRRGNPYRRNSADEELRRLQRLAQTGDPAARQAYEAAMGRVGRMAYRPRWAQKVSQIRKAKGISRRCPVCRRALWPQLEPMRVYVEQAQDAVTEEGNTVRYGTPGSEPQAFVFACSRCANQDEYVDGSSWEEVDPSHPTPRGAWTILYGEDVDVAARLRGQGYDPMLVNSRRRRNPKNPATAIIARRKTPRAQREVYDPTYEPLSLQGAKRFSALRRALAEVTRQRSIRDTPELHHRAFAIVEQLARANPRRGRKNPIASGVAQGLASGAAFALANGVLRGRRNPHALMAIIGNPQRGRPRRRNEGAAKNGTLKLPDHLYKGTITIAEAIRRKIPGIHEAIKGFSDFHGGLEPSDEVVMIDDGRKDQEAIYLQGRTPEVTYMDPPAGSNKEGDPWGHATSRSRPTYLTHSPRTGMFHLFGGMRSDTWLRG